MLHMGVAVAHRSLPSCGLLYPSAGPAAICTTIDLLQNYVLVQVFLETGLGKLAVPCGSDASDFIRRHQLPRRVRRDIEKSGNMVSAAACVACFIRDLEYVRRSGITTTLAIIVLTLTRVR